MMIGMYAENIEIIAEADGVKSGIQCINDHKPDLVFLDIQMGDGTGFDLLNYFPKKNFKVVFVTAFEEYALKAFRFSALDYLVKPVSPDDLMRVVAKLEEQSSDIETHLEVFNSNKNKNSGSFGKIILKTTEAIYVVGIEDIIQCESENNYTTFYLNSGKKLLVSRTLKEYDDLLSEVGFIRVHRSHLINSRHIDYFDKRDGGSVVMKDNSRVPVSSRKKDQLISTIQKAGREL